LRVCSLRGGLQEKRWGCAYIYTPEAAAPADTWAPRVREREGRSMNMLVKDCAIYWRCWEMVGNLYSSIGY
jgi:hypothetical protein